MLRDKKKDRKGIDITMGLIEDPFTPQISNFTTKRISRKKPWSYAKWMILLLKCLMTATSEKYKDNASNEDEVEPGTPLPHTYLLILLFPILVIIIVEVNSEFAEESHQSPKQRLTIVEPYQGVNNVAIDQDEYSNEREHIHNPSIQLHPSGRVMIPPPVMTSSYNQLQWGSPPLDRSSFSSIGSDDTLGNPKKKKDCGFPVLSRRLIGPVLKRAQRDLPYFANSDEEMKEKSREEDSALARVKRGDPSMSETHSGGCLAKRQWIDLGGDFYPRYVKSYHCSSNACDRGYGALGECVARHYTTKVLKRLTPADNTAALDDCDRTLPESLRFDWKLISVTVTTCCDCASPGRLFGLK